MNYREICFLNTDGLTHSNLLKELFFQLLLSNGALILFIFLNDNSILIFVQLNWLCWSTQLQESFYLLCK